MTPFGTLLRRFRLATTRTGQKVYANGPVRWRLSESISQRELAMRSGIDAAYVHRFELGLSEKPRRSVVDRLAVGLDLDDLGTARLLVAAGYWPFPELDDDATDLALGVIFAIGSGDYRLFGETAQEQAASSG